MTHPTLEDAGKALWDDLRTEIHRGRQLPEWGELEPEERACWCKRARAALLSIRPPDREDLPLRQLEARDYIDGILEK